MEDRIRELEEQIRRADKAYWEDASPIMEDTEYDKLVEELRALDSENPLVNAVHASGNLDTSKLVKHPVPMLSLQKAYSLEEVIKWAKKYARTPQEKFIIMPKYDGMSGRWQDGKLTSRGNGEWGQDYTDRAPLVKGLPEPSHEPVYGEILITDEQWKSFGNVQTKSGAPFKNQRNAAAGIIGCDDIDFYLKQGQLLAFKDYRSFETHVTLKQLEEDWDETVKNIQAVCECPIDGIVVKLEDLEYWKSLGSNAHHPYGSIAFKFTNTAVWTKLIGVTWTMGKGQISAVGQVRPIDINGITVQNAKLQLTPAKTADIPFCILDGTLQLGDDVLVERAGDIIPHICDAKPAADGIRKKVDITHCPWCGAPVEVDGSAVRCTNDECEEKIVQKLLFAVKTLGFKGISEAYARKLNEVLGVKTVEGLLTASEAQLREHPEFGDKLVTTFIQEQQKALKSTQEQMLVSLDMPEVGKFTSKKLLENFTWSQVLDGDIDEGALSLISGIGPKTAKIVCESLKKNSEAMKSLAKLFNFSEKKPAVASAKGFVCFTGKSEFPRKEMQQKAIEMGWAVEDGITSNTTLLVCADPASGSSKLKKAASKGIKIMSDVDFLAGRA